MFYSLLLDSFYLQVIKTIFILYTHFFVSLFLYIQHNLKLKTYTTSYNFYNVRMILKEQK